MAICIPPKKLADLLLANPAELEPLTNLKRVTIHSWGTGKAVDIGLNKPVFGPIYQGTTPSNQPLAMTAEIACPTPDQP